MSDEKKTETEPVRERLPMTCRHGGNKADADQVMADLKEQMAALGHGDIMTDFLSRIVSSLEHDLDGWEIDFLACDMWFGAGLKRTKYLNGEVVTTHLLGTEGDTAEDCLAQLWLRAAEITPPTTG